jgi:hypothetical protein
VVITGLVDIRSSERDRLTVNPLIPADTRDYFCLKNVIKDHKLTILYDKSGKKYKCGKGLLVFVDGKLKEKQKDLDAIYLFL